MKQSSRALLRRNLLVVHDATGSVTWPHGRVWIRFKPHVLLVSAPDVNRVPAHCCRSARRTLDTERFSKVVFTTICASGGADTMGVRLVFGVVDEEFERTPYLNDKVGKVDAVPERTEDTRLRSPGDLIFPRGE
jgi:hypothetical protein